MFTGPNIRTSNLQLYYDFGNVNCYPGTGTGLTNLIQTNSGVGYLKNDVTFSADFGGILRTGGTTAGGSGTNVVGDRIDINTNGGSGIDRFSQTTNFSFLFWVRYISGGGNKIFSTGSSGSGNTDSCIWQFWVNNAQWYWWNSGGGSANALIRTFPSTLSSNIWYHLGFVYSYNESGNNYMRIYKDGELWTTGTIATATHSGRDRTTQTNLQYTLGGGYTSSCNNNNSECDFGNFMCYNETLTLADVKNIYNGTKSRYL